MENHSVNLREAKGLVIKCLRAGIIPFIQASPGLGKSDMATQIAEEFELEYLDFRLTQADPTDLQGLIDFKDEKAVYRPLSIFPLEDTQIPEGKKGWLLNFEEINTAIPAVQAAAYKLLSRQVGDFTLHKNVAMIACGNLATDRAIVNRMGTAMASRVAHILIHADKDIWIEDFARPRNINHKIQSFLHFRPNLLHNFNPKKDGSASTFAAPRTWWFLHKIIENEPDELEPSLLPLIVGVIGEGAGREFYAYTQVYKSLPSVPEVIKGTAKVPTDISAQYALTGMLPSAVNDKTADVIVTYIKALNIDLQVIFMRNLFSINKKARGFKAVKSWIRECAHEFF